MPPTEASVKAVLEQHGLRAKKAFGQNFLTDRTLAERIAEEATTPPGGSVLELGAGLGALTRPLLARAQIVMAIERDRDLVPLLAERFSAEVVAGRVRIVEADAKAVDFVAHLTPLPRPRVVAGNLPYQITGPLLEKVCGLSRQLDRAVFLVQLEVAERICAGPGSSAYGALSVFVQIGYEPRRVAVVKRGAFYPQPGVDSAVVVLEPREVVLAEEDAVLRAVVRAAFGQRRKTLRNAWRGVCGLALPELQALAARCEIDLDARGETLSPQAFARFSAEIRG